MATIKARIATAVNFMVPWLVPWDVLKPFWFLDKLKVRSPLRALVIAPTTRSVWHSESALLTQITYACDHGVCEYIESNKAFDSKI